LWCLNGYTDKPLNVRTNKGEWLNFDLGVNARNKYTKKMIVDFQGNVWCATDNDGLFGYNANNTITDLSDDKKINLKSGVNYGDLPSENITAIAADFDGEIWIGTDAGFAILYNANSSFDASPGDYDAQRIKVQFEGNVEYVLGSTHITDIEVDGGNRKWMATANAGILLLSQDGSEILESLGLGFAAGAIDSESILLLFSGVSADCTDSAILSLEFCMLACS
jgi:ligand-binding sensor domain-containing protein